MKRLIATVTVLICGVVAAQAADVRTNNHRRDSVVVVQPQQPVEPLRQIPIVGTVVYGGLNYAGALILSPVELVTGPRR